MERILVALSGGVDSSAAAAILKQNGYHVEGAIMVFRGVSQEAIHHASEVAQQLCMPFYRFDFAREFRDMIISDFVEEYKRGRTPNPCILCNKQIKFGLFMQKAEEMGIDKVATGHYARIENENRRFLLKRGIDENEQSYFLYRLDQRQLARIVLPLGSYTKGAVRKLARKKALQSAHRNKSQDVCFVPDGDYMSYLQRIVPQQSGPVYNMDGQVIGQHRGIMYYTYGQRRRIGISHKRPYYVIKIDARNNAIYVGERKDTYRSQIIARDLNFIPFDKLTRRLRVQAKPRYVSPLASAVIEPFTEDSVRVTFEKPQWALTPGQSIVFYQGDVVLGGGVIDEINSIDQIRMR